jgi:hypothetical protein
MVAANNSPPRPDNVESRIADYQQVYELTKFACAKAMLCNCAACKVVKIETTISVVTIGAAIMALRGKPKMLDELLAFCETLIKKHEPKKDEK